jgi:hypothetical protein
LIGTSEAEERLGRPRCIWEDNIKMNFKETGSEGLDWNHVAKDRDQWHALVNTVMNIRGP